jgi:hypothetical protein
MITSQHALKLSSNIAELQHAISWNTGKIEELREQITIVSIWCEECSMPECFTCDYNRDEIVSLTLDINELTLANEELTDTLQCRMLELEIEMLPTWYAKYALTEQNGKIVDCLVKASSYQSALNAFTVTHAMPCVLLDFVLIAE